MAVLLNETQSMAEKELIKGSYLTKEQLDLAHKSADHSSDPFLAVLVKDGYVSGETLTKILAKINKVPYVNLSNTLIDANVLSFIPQDVAERYMAVPIGEMQNRLVVAMLDADNVQAVDFLSKKIGKPIKVYSASEDSIRNILKQYKTNIDEEVVDVLASTSNEEEIVDLSNKEKNIKTIVQDSPISKALSAILEYAIKNRASDIHIEPMEDSLKIRCRIDGMLREIMKLPKSTEAPLVSRVKILSSLKIDEHRLPQDGQFTVKLLNNDIDLRIAISPVVWGEQVVIRLLDKSSTSLKLEDMGYYGRALREIRKGLERPSGMILTSGPTGSGKSTSLYALIQEIKNENINIITLEDPVEYKMPGINQIQVNNEVGLTFANGLRSILRHDPDVIMVGEIRDKDTATLAIQAALTGHLVFSTLHTNSAAGILPRLLDMGIEPFLIASTVHTVIGQRLIRRLADDKEEYSANASEVDAIHRNIGNLLPNTAEEISKVAEDLGYESLPLASQNAYTLYKGKDSTWSPGGYKEEWAFMRSLK